MNEDGIIKELIRAEIKYKADTILMILLFIALHFLNDRTIPMTASGILIFSIVFYLFYWRKCFKIIKNGINND